MLVNGHVVRSVRLTAVKLGLSKTGQGPSASQAHEEKSHDASDAGERSQEPTSAAKARRASSTLAAGHGACSDSERQSVCEAESQCGVFYQRFKDCCTQSEGRLVSGLADHLDVLFMEGKSANGGGRGVPPCGGQKQSYEVLAHSAAALLSPFWAPCCCSMRASRRLRSSRHAGAASAAPRLPPWPRAVGAGPNGAVPAPPPRTYATARAHRNCRKHRAAMPSSPRRAPACPPAHIRHLRTQFTALTSRHGHRWASARCFSKARKRSSMLWLFSSTTQGRERSAVNRVLSSPSSRDGSFILKATHSQANKFLLQRLQTAARINTEHRIAFKGRSMAEHTPHWTKGALFSDGWPNVAWAVFGACSSLTLAGALWNSGLASVEKTLEVCRIAACL